MALGIRLKRLKVSVPSNNPKMLYETSCLPTLGDASDFSCKILGQA